MSELKKNIEEYLKGMGDKEQKTYLIAKECLETSFDISKSNGFKQYMKKVNKIN
jgi:hypothetical protein